MGYLKHLKIAKKVFKMLEDAIEFVKPEIVA